MQNQRRPELIGAVLDTSVVISAFQSRRGASAEIFRLWRTQLAFQWILSDPILEEITRVLLERDVPEAAVYDLIRALYLQALLTDNTYVVKQITADPSDNIF